MRTFLPKGFSLVELLVVLAIVGIMLASISLSTGQSQLRQLETERKRLALLIQATAERSVTLGVDHTILVSSQGLRFFEHRDGRLQELAVAPLQFRPWPDGMSVQIEGSPELQARATGLFSPTVIHLELAGLRTRAAFNALGYLQ